MKLGGKLNNRKIHVSDLKIYKNAFSVLFTLREIYKIKTLMM